MNTNTGGPAFPNTVKVTDENFAELRGMTLRDYFAAKAMQEMAWAEDGSNDPRARMCYEIADAMLRAREAV